MATTKKIHQQLKRLDTDQLHLVADYISLLLEQGEPEDEAGVVTGGNGGQGSFSGNGRKGGSGWIELKYIKGYGPYAYRRWRDGKRLRSKYLGRVKSEAQASLAG